MPLPKYLNCYICEIAIIVDREKADHILWYGIPQMILCHRCTDNQLKDEKRSRLQRR